MAVHTFNPSNPEAEVREANLGNIVSFRSARTMYVERPCLNREKKRNIKLVQTSLKSFPNML